MCALLRPVFAIAFPLRRAGVEHIPRDGPAILAANHRTMLDPIVVGLLARRPVHFIAMQELFRYRWPARFLSALGAFPVDRRSANPEAVEIAQHILGRGDCLVIFPEGRCIPPGPLGTPRRGVGRLALATGAPVVPIALMHAAPRWRFVPRSIRVQVGAPLALPLNGEPASPDTIRAATDRIWAAVTGEWEAVSAAAAPVNARMTTVPKDGSHRSA
jgi:1-acyl-sn-glycerol-3-phosphate acyltransferase